METLKKLIKQAATQIDREREIFANSLGVTGVQMSVIDFYLIMKTVLLRKMKSSMNLILSDQQLQSCCNGWRNMD